MSSFNGNLSTRNNVLSAFSYSMGSDDLNQRQSSVNEDNNKCQENQQQTENIHFVEIVIEDNDYNK
jgi:hypothetical protein